MQDSDKAGGLSPAVNKAGGSNRKSGSGSESPKLPEGGRRRFGAIADDLDVSKMNGDSAGEKPVGGQATPEQLEALKQDILREMRKEVNQMKQDIIEGEL